MEIVTPAGNQNSIWTALLTLKQIIMKTIKNFINDNELPHPFVAVLSAELITIVALLLF